MNRSKLTRRDFLTHTAAGGANFLLDVPPDKHGLIPDETVAALTRLRKNLKI